MDHQWARDIRARCEAAGTAFFFKQSSDRFSERGVELDGQIVREYPTRRLALPGLKAEAANERSARRRKDEP